MRYILAVFSTRRDAVAFFDKIKTFKIYADIVSTPREITSSCGVCVKIRPEALMRIKNIAFNYNSFVAFYYVEECFGKKHIALL